MSLPVLVLAGSRGPDDPVARAAGVAHKCAAPLLGRPMLAYVLDAIRATPGLGSVFVAAEAGADALLAEALAAANAEPPTWLPAEAGPSASVAAGFERIGAPLLVTTGDHPLLDGAMLGAFLAAAREAESDVVAGVVGRETLEGAGLATKRTWLAFKDGDISGANLFYLGDARAASAVAFWGKIERERKNPLKLAAAFGPLLLAAYVAKRLTLDAACRRIGPTLGCSAAAVRLDRAEAAIDVDKAADLDLAEAIIARRGAGPAVGGEVRGNE